MTEEGGNELLDWQSRDEGVCERDALVIIVVYFCVCSEAVEEYVGTFKEGCEIV